MKGAAFSIPVGSSGAWAPVSAPSAPLITPRGASYRQSARARDEVWTAGLQRSGDRADGGLPSVQRNPVKPPASQPIVAYCNDGIARKLSGKCNKGLAFRNRLGDTSACMTTKREAESG